MDGDDYRGEAMDGKHLLAYITGTVDQELLLRNEYLVTYRKNKRYFATATARTTRRIPRVSFFSPTKHFACILNK